MSGTVTIIDLALIIAILALAAAIVLLDLRRK